MKGDDYNFFAEQYRNDEISFVDDILARTTIEGYKHIYQDKKRLQHAIGGTAFQKFGDTHKTGLLKQLKVVR